MPTYRLIIEYDGSKFSGWQTQLKHRTVQGVLISVFRELLGDQGLTLQGAGRTDAGVHALGQVASLRCARRFAVDRTLDRLERALPSDLAVLDIRPAADGFHARHDAVARCYRYQITRRRSAFGKRATWWLYGALDIERMRTAAGLFVGRHDFAAFARAGHAAPSTIVVVDECALWEFGELVLLRLVASHFLWGQVRRMVGALVAVGRGAADPSDVTRWLDGSAPPPEPAAPASGLFLERVLYPGESRTLPPPTPVGVPWPRPDGNRETGDAARPSRPDTEARRPRRSRPRGGRR
jgi:tRNA pseudouridine38-40 synthase